MSFLKGRITDNLEPMLDDVAILGTSGAWISFDAILDTGFNGSLVLPRKIGRRARLAPAHQTQYQLADGSVVRDILYRGTLRFAGRRIDVLLSLTDSDLGLVGMEIIAGRVATFDLRKMTVDVT